MKYAIYTVVNNDVRKSLLTILSSQKYNDVDHYIFYDENFSSIIKELKINFNNVKLIEIQEFASELDLKSFSKFVDDSHHPACLFAVEYLKGYDSIIYISDRIHVTREFEIEKYNLSRTFVAPPIAIPFNDDFVSNNFINTHKLNNKTFLSDDFVVVNTAKFIENKVLTRLMEFSEELYYQSKIDLNTNVLKRVPSLIVYNIFTANCESFDYLPQNYMLDIAYTSDFVGEMISFYQKEQLDYFSLLENQIEFTQIDFESDIYNLEYVLTLLNFMLESNIVEESIVVQNMNVVNEIILNRNKSYQMRLGQC
ncbi:hypothetical protein R2F61_01345 [Mollicutes bacterium LVI A0078]|nr:hypothetical protein RZE84_01340 [Mollicutes bacterium LVI A0075]WOO91223.1 hypothetical protein R2F61_01345 [Mollicutes bacterium LVI A0078]